MSLWHIAWSYLWNRRFTTALTILSVALGVGLISTVLTLREETRKRFEEEGSAFDIVVGAKANSPLELVLSTVYFLDQPRETILVSDYERLRNEEEVVAAFPIGMGDSYGQFRIIGTSPEFFGATWSGTGRNAFAFAGGRCFDKPFEAVVGALAAEETGLQVGIEFQSMHGYGAAASATGHAPTPYTVVGILERSYSPSDRAIFCDIQSVWDAHAHHGGEGGETEEQDGHVAVRDKLTAVLVKLASPAMRPRFRSRVNREYNVLAAIPINVIQEFYDQLLGIAKAVLLAIGYLVVVISSISILIGLYMAILQRKRDLAVMRALGASRGEIFGAVIIEAFWVTVLGLGAGWVLGSGTCWALGLYLAEQTGFRVSALTMCPDLVTAYSAVILMGLVAGILPAWQAYRSDVARDLAEL